MSKDLSGYASLKKTHPRSHSLSDRDEELIRRIADFYNCSKSEAVRMSIRFYAVTLFGKEGLSETDRV